MTAFILTPSLVAQSVSMGTWVVPSFADLTIRTQRAFGSTTRITEILSLKGARQRREEIIEEPGRKESRCVTITQCDRQRTILLNVAARLFGISNLRTPSPWLRYRRPVPEATGADVTTTFDAVDTGERRTIGRYVARRVRSTISVEPSLGAWTPPSTTETDGWYIDLPGLDCSAESTAFFLSAENVASDGRRDRHLFKTIRTAKRGYAIELTTRLSQSGVTRVDASTLIQASEGPLDPSLFEIPADYRPALPFLTGGFDMEKPDTIANRLHLYSTQLAALIRSAVSR
jgi:hypothetical protein